MGKDLQSNISLFIKRELKRRKWTIHKLWKETGIPRSSLYFMLDNTNNWTIEALLKISETLNVSMEELLSNTSSDINRNLVYEVEYLKEENKTLKEELAIYKTVLNTDALKKLKEHKEKIK